MSLVWINGQLVDKAEARVSPFDHGFLYGDGVWEPLRVFRGQLFRPDDHYSFLHSAATALGIDLPLTKAQLVEAIEITIRTNNRTEGYVRVIVTRGPGTLGPDPRKLDPQVLIIAEEYLPFPAELYEHGLHVVMAPTRLDLSDPGHTLHVLGRPHVVLAKRHAIRNGCLEAVFLTADGTVVGCTEGTLFLVRQGMVTPLPAHPPDATWAAVIEIARGIGPTVPVSGATRTELFAADEVFLAGTSCGVIAVVQTDGRPIGSGTEGPLTRQLRLAYRQLTRGE